MGNQASLSAKVHDAVQKNDLVAFTALMNELGRLCPDDPAARAHVLEQRDMQGRTLLMQAAAKNDSQIMERLIQLGANVHYISPSRAARCTRRRHGATRRQWSCCWRRA